MRPAPKARTGPWRRDSPCPREISGLYVTDWSEVRVLPEEQIAEAPLTSGPIDTTLEPMFYRLDAHMRDLRLRFPGGGRSRRPQVQPSRSQTMPRMSSPDRAEEAAAPGAPSAQVTRVRRFWWAVPGQDGDRRKSAFALPSLVLPRVLAVRRSQHIESSARLQVNRGSHKGTA